MYINSSFSSAKALSNPEAGCDLGKSMSADQLRKHSDSELSGSRGKTEMLIKTSGSSQSEGALVSSGKLTLSSPDNSGLPTIAVPRNATSPAAASDSSAGARPMSQSAKLQPREQLLLIHERYGNGPVIFHNPSCVSLSFVFFFVFLYLSSVCRAPKSKDASPTHLRRVSMDDGNRSPLKESKNGGDSPKMTKP